MSYLLNNLFYELRDDGYIYDEDENGQNMSYGEYAAINTTFQDNLVDEILRIDDFEKAADTLKEIMDATMDDVRIFFDTEEYDNFDYYIDEDNGTIELYSVPVLLKDHLEELAERWKDEHAYLYEDDEEYMEVA